MHRIENEVDLATLRTKVRARRAGESCTVTLCMGSGCRASGAEAVHAELLGEISARGLGDRVVLRTTGCHGFCEQGPMMVVEPGNVFYCHVQVEDVSAILDETVLAGRVIERLLYTDPVSGVPVRREADVPFYQAQNRLLLGKSRQLDPTSIEEYVAAGGYGALVKALAMTPEEILSEVRAAGLRGRGGGGFPTARKWQATREACGEHKYVICNADEGDPGAYMNRSLLEGNPHAVIEGMVIGAYAIGAHQGYVYVRTEYPLAVEHVRAAIDQARARGLLGEDILGSGFSFDLSVSRGAGAFVAGESTALMAALNGEVGEPRPKDTHTSERGLREQPTTLNNVETWADIPLIIEHGADWFASHGSAHNTGTKIFALTGQVKNTGLVEVDLGTPLKHIIYDIGGGPVDGKALKAVQVGGPSGGCLPTSLFDLPVDFDSLTSAGAMMGSGGMVVMDESSCMVDVARYFLEFLRDESCGKCAPCRLGVARMLEIVTDICEGRGTREQLDLLEELGETVALTSMCGLGKSAANPVLTTLRYFRDEYEAHVVERRCPAGVCRALVQCRIDPVACTGCGVCARACPQGAISGERREAHVIDQHLCTRCGICRDECRFDAIVVR